MQEPILLIDKLRQGGKTTEIIKAGQIKNEKDRALYIVTFDLKSVRSILEAAKQLKCEIRHPITFAEFLNMRDGGARNTYLIDDYDDFTRFVMKYILRDKEDSIKAISYTSDKNPFIEEKLFRKQYE